MSTDALRAAIEAAHAEEIARLTRELDAARAHRTIAVRERDIALSERDAARADDAMHFEQLRHVDGVLAEARAELKRVTEILASHLERGPLSWDDVGWDSSMPDDVAALLGLREEGGALRRALISVEKAALVGAAAALAAPPKQRKRAKVERTNRADVRLTPAASQIVADEGLLRDDVAALLGRYTKIARTLEIAAGRGTIREAREAAGLSLGQAVRLVPWDRAHMEAIEATGVMLPEERAALCSVYGVAGFVDEFGMQGGER